MKKLSIIIVSAGVKLWDELTVPALNGLRQFGDSSDEIVTVDNGGLGRGVVNFSHLVPYASAVNDAARFTTGDRLLILNNDIHVHGPYREHIGAYPFEGKTILPDSNRDGFVQGWLISIDTGLWEILNGFDERLKNSWEDVDLSHRVRLLGFKYHRINPPIDHYGGRSVHATKQHVENYHVGERLCALKKKRMKWTFTPNLRD